MSLDQNPFENEIRYKVLHSFVEDEEIDLKISKVKIIQDKKDNSVILSKDSFSAGLISRSHIVISLSSARKLFPQINWNKFFIKL